jgi:hypothetical protein
MWVFGIVAAMILVAAMTWLLPALLRPGTQGIRIEIDRVQP